MLSFRFKTLALALALVATVGFLTMNLSPAVYGQTIVSGDISGTVTDSTSAVVVGATITLTSDADASTREVKTGSDGSFRFTLLVQGNTPSRLSSSGMVGAASHVNVSVGRTSPVSITVQARYSGH